ncbi:MAG: hypothetical protein COW30_00360 [Rhodospirillales bacterium CG15_BIG_FIL_POST_REV_8_21_14_020_66_15]|nr:MAG: hypothetical protein COW30_00360 [Rhodospirillales bacterium CG15_BIG_FIL_POST_REV_8_21_14_020_66_15]
MKNLGLRMKTIAVTAALASAVALASATAQAGSIVGSKHDLSSGGAGQGAASSTTTQICVFCHTPHGSDISAQAPLWNKALPDPATYTTYSNLGTATLDGNEAPVGSVSLACLSCHDGSQAMDTVLNAPGSGGFNASGAAFAGLAAMTGTPIPNLGTDLQNDHPIGIVYGAHEGPDTASYVATSNATVNGNLQYWVNSKGSADAGREKVDMILYSRADGKPRVECASCHDPHNGPDGVVNNIFLRIANTSSNVCLSCHVK